MGALRIEYVIDENRFLLNRNVVADPTLKRGDRPADIADMPRPAPAHRARPNEAAVGMVEVMVVLLIVGLLASLAAWGVQSSRRTGQVLGSSSAARAYTVALDDFARDHGGRYPTGPGTRDWSTTPARGPVATLAGGEVRPYLRRVPESIQDGSVAFATTGRARIWYRQLAGGRGYELRVDVEGRPPCAIHGGRAAAPAGAIAECG